MKVKRSWSEINYLYFIHLLYVYIHLQFNIRYDIDLFIFFRVQILYNTSKVIKYEILYNLKKKINNFNNPFQKALNSFQVVVDYGKQQ